MKKSVHEVVTSAFDAYLQKNREEWVLEWAGQAVQSIAMTYWTSEVTEAINTGTQQMEETLSKSNYQISKIVDLVRGSLSLQNRITLGMEVLIGKFFNMDDKFMLFYIFLQAL